MATALIPHTLEGHLVHQRGGDGYVDATAMCKAAGKLWADYNRLGGTKEFMRTLEADMGIPMSELIQTVRGGLPELQGTWVHPRVAVHLGHWLSPRFAVRVGHIVFDWMKQRSPSPIARHELPYHLDRYVRNIRNVPRGHFSVLTEMTLMLVAPLELEGYTLPETMWPDISEGRMWAGWLRDQGIEPGDLPYYLHEFADGRRPVRARAYPDRLLAAFRNHMIEVWLPNRAVAYFKERDPIALAYLPKLLAPPKAA